MRGTWIAAAVAGMAVLAASCAAAGERGLAVAGTALAVAALLATRAALPQRGVRRPAIRPQERPPVSAADFAVYRRISSELGWAGISWRHYDHGIRPRLSRLLGVLAAQRSGADVDQQPDQGRRLAGEDLWPLIDPSRPASQDSSGPGVDLATLQLVVERLEKL